MDYRYIDQLLERYWKCETSLEEEQILRSFFCQTDIPAEYRRYRSLFVYEQTQPKTETLGEDFDERMERIIDAPVIVKAHIVPLRQRLAPLFKAAALVAVILTLSNAAQFSFMEEGTQSVPVRTARQPSHGVSVALGDSMKTDTVKVGSIEAAQPKGSEIILK